MTAIQLPLSLVGIRRFGGILFDEHGAGSRDTISPNETRVLAAVGATVGGIVPTVPRSSIPASEADIDELAGRLTTLEGTPGPFRLTAVDSDLNDAPVGFSLAQNGRAHHPITDRAATVMLTTLPFDGFDAPYIFQTAVAEDNGQTFSRFAYAGTWYPWQTS